MDLTRRRRAFALLRDALALAPAEREAFVVGGCGDDADMAAQVREWIAASEGGGGVLDRDLAAVAAPLLDTDDEALPGAKIGAWRLQRELGRGGMGTVYLAERRGDGFDQRGALKLIKRGMDSRDVLARFRRERHILARLAHPHIARLLDGGVSDDGRPYLVMAYVEGESLDAWAMRPDIDLAARVALILQLADALAHAHRQLVVHRDLKPSNVLVDTAGDAHLLDFGIAKLLHDTDDAAATATAARFLTRAYAAPEQTRGDAVSTATDVYQLGVLLFELCSGVRFHDAASGKPSARLADARAANVSGPIAVATKALRGDLSVIAARATETEPARRYASVEAFAEDLRRWRDGRPILARPDSAGYRITRFIARHRLAVAAGLCVIAAIVGGASLALWQARLARAEAARAEAVNGFLESIFGSLDPANARGRTVSAKELVDDAARRIDRELATQPLAAAQLHRVLAETYVGLGDRAEAEAQYRAALALYGDAPLSAAVTARAGLANVRLESGDLKGAQSLIAAAEQMRASELADDAELREYLLLVRAGIAASAGDQAEAAKTAQEALALRRQRLGADDLLTLEAEQITAVNLAAMGDNDEAVKRIRHVVDGRRSLLGHDHPDLGSPLFNLATFQANAGDFEGSLATTEEAMALRRKVLPAQHPDIARTLGRKALDLAELGRAQDAVALRPEVIAILRAQAQPDNPLLAQELNNWGVNCYQVGDLDCAAQHIAEALALWQADLPADHAFVLSARSSLAALETNRGRLKEGESQLRAVLAAREPAMSRPDPSSSDLEGWLQTRGALAANLRYQGRAAEAVDVARVAWDRAKTFYAAPNQMRSNVSSDLSRSLAEAGKCEEAELLAKAALEEAEALKPAGAMERGVARDVLGICALNARRYPDALTHFQAAISEYTAGSNAEHWRVALARGRMGLVLANLHRTAEAKLALDAASIRLSEVRPWMSELAAINAARK